MQISGTFVILCSDHWTLSCYLELWITQLSGTFVILPFDRTELTGWPGTIATKTTGQTATCDIEAIKNRFEGVLQPLCRENQSQQGGFHNGSIWFPAALTHSNGFVYIFLFFHLWLAFFYPAPVAVCNTHLFVFHSSPIPAEPQFQNTEIQ